MQQPIDVELELFEPIGREGRRSITHARLGLQLLAEACPATCALISNRLPIEAQSMLACFGGSRHEGLTTLDVLVACWDRDPEDELRDCQPEVGLLYYRPYPVGAPRPHRNPQQRQVQLSLCLGVPPEGAGWRIKGAPFACAPPGESLASLTETAVRLEDDRFRAGARPAVRLAAASGDVAARAPLQEEKP